MPVSFGALGRRLDVLEHVLERRLVGERHRDRLVELRQDRLGLGVAVQEVDRLAVPLDPPLGEARQRSASGYSIVIVSGKGTAARSTSWIESMKRYSLICSKASSWARKPVVWETNNPGAGRRVERLEGPGRLGEHPRVVEGAVVAAMSPSPPLARTLYWPCAIRLSNWIISVLTVSWFLVSWSRARTCCSADGLEPKRLGPSWTIRSSARTVARIAF